MLKIKSTVGSLLLSAAFADVWATPVSTRPEKAGFAGVSVQTVDVRTTEELFAARDRLRKKKPTVFPDKTTILGVRQSPPPAPEVFVDGTRYEMASWPNDRQWATFTNIVTVGAGWSDKGVTNRLGQLNVPGTFGYDGDRPLGARQAGLVRGWITASYDIIPKSKHQ